MRGRRIYRFFNIFANDTEKNDMEKTTDTPSQGRMNIWGLLRNLLPFVLPYRWLIAVTLVLTFVGSLMAQVNAVVLDRAVDAINALIQTPGGFQWGAAVRILTVIIISHNIGQIIDADQIYVLEKGRAVSTAGSACRPSRCPPSSCSARLPHPVPR